MIIIEGIQSSLALDMWLSLAGFDAMDIMRLRD